MYVTQIRKWHVRITAWLFDRKYRNVPIRVYSSISALATEISKVSQLFYRRDSWMRLWDSISYPGRFQTFLDNGKITEDSNDCDDFANYIAHALMVSKLPDITDICLLAVFWMGSNNLPNGHVVCLFKHRNLYAYMDYGYPNYGQSVKEIAEMIVARYNGTELLMWAELAPNTFHAYNVKRN